MSHYNDDDNDDDGNGNKNEDALFNSVLFDIAQSSFYTIWYYTI